MLKIKNLSISEGQEEMLKVDDYINDTTDMYRNLFAKSPSVDDFLELMSNSVISVTEEQQKVIEASEKMINMSLDECNIKINFDMEMLYTNGTDNVGMPYTKGHAMVMPEVFHSPPGVLNYLNPHLVAHELWHILSREFPDLRKAAYKAVGFAETDTVLSEKEGYKELIENQYFINPDAIYHDHYMEQQSFFGKVSQLYPILYLDSSGMVPGLVYVQNNKIEKLAPLYSNSKYVNTFKNIGYITHPEEVCAEHFRLMIMDKHEQIIKNLPDKEMMSNFIAVVSGFFKQNHKKTLKIQ